MELRTVVIHQSLHKHNLVLGAEREPVMVSALIAILVGVGGMTLVSAVIALLFWIFALFALRRMAKADPLMTKVWLNHVKQQGFYHARSGRWRTMPSFNYQKATKR